MATFRIWYGDESTYSDDDGELWAAPSVDVVCVTYRTNDPQHSTSHMIVHTFDFYWWDAPDWFGGELFGLFDYLTRPGRKKVIFGRTIPTGKYREIISKAIERKEFAR